MQFNTIIQPQALAEYCSVSPCILLDCRHDLTQPDAGRQAYEQGHLPGAHFFHLDEDLSGPKNGRNGRHPLPDPAVLAAKLGAVGIEPGIPVVAYDDQGGAFAARAWWLLRWLGHTSVAVLDGGFSAWREAGYAIDIQTPPRREAALPFAELLPTINSQQLLEKLYSTNLMLLDARAPDRFQGENETLDPVGGHITGAINRFFKLNLDDRGRFKTAAQLRQEFSALLPEPSSAPIIHQCGSGVTACHNILAMEIAGLSGSILYPGSWSEWCSDPTRPMVTR